MTDRTPAQRFADAVSELKKLEAEGHEVSGLHRLRLSAKAEAVRAEKAKPKPVFKPRPIFSDENKEGDE